MAATEPSSLSAGPPSSSSGTLLSDPDARFHDLGPDHGERTRSTANVKRSAVRTLEAIGYVTLTPAA
ncbi:hypothetical protein ABT304_21670 [Nocardioides sp. NPDC000445]|uniref:hypothetical protein n=1 Tax=Nocardioides sp. NPDC000445 TaxID=3154257 RepID=UPI0033334060